MGLVNYLLPTSLHNGAGPALHGCRKRGCGTAAASAMLWQRPLRRMELPNPRRNAAVRLRHVRAQADAAAADSTALPSANNLALQSDLQGDLWLWRRQHIVQIVKFCGGSLRDLGTPKQLGKACGESVCAPPITEHCGNDIGAGAALSLPLVNPLG